MKTQSRQLLPVALLMSMLMLSSCFLFNRNPNTAQRGNRFPHDSDKPKQEKEKESGDGAAKSRQ